MKVDGTLQGARSGVSCTECQRRKQRCSKDWPCGHCQNRRVPHLCHFPTKGGVASVAGTKRKGSNSTARDSEPTTDAPDVADDGWTDGVAEMGYMGGADPFNVDHHHHHHHLSQGESERPVVDDGHCGQDQMPSWPRPSEMPNRSLTDKLVHEHLNTYNFHYYCIHPPAFLRDYVEWWDATSQRRPVSRSFTALLLQILALAVQFLRPETRLQVEYELAEGVQLLTEKYNAAANRLSQEIAPGQGGLHHVEQLFLAACWLKAEAKFVESWHALGRTIREAQEQGLHRPEVASSVEVHEWHNALRCRMWCILYVWDWYMAGWLGRPFSIDHSQCHVETRIIHINGAETAIDPFDHITLQCRLIQAVARYQANNDFRPATAVLLDLQRVFDDWQATLPDHIRLQQDASLDDDEEHSFVPVQRLQLHAIASVMRLTPLKPYLVKPVPANSTAEEDRVREIAVSCMLGLLAMSKTLFDVGVDAKDHLVAFCLFDTGALACSAIMHGVSKAVGREEEIRDAIDTTLARLSDLARDSKPAAKSYRVLSRLVRRLPQSSSSRPEAGRMAKKAKTSPASTMTVSEAASDSPLDAQVPPLSSSGFLGSPGSRGSDVSGWVLGSDNNQSPPPGADDLLLLPWPVPDETMTSTGSRSGSDARAQHSPIPPEVNGGDDEFAYLDYGGFEEVWSWQDLNLDPYSALPMPPHS